jgi:hypothetical protein
LEYLVLQITMIIAYVICCPMKLTRVIYNLSKFGHNVQLPCVSSPLFEKLSEFFSFSHIQLLFLILAYVEYRNGLIISSCVF